MPEKGFSISDLIHPQRREYSREPSPSDYQFAKPHLGRNAARRVLKDLMVTAMPVDLDSVCHYLAARVIRISLAPQHAWGRYMGDGVVEIAEGLPETVFRSTLAHELGHMALQHDVRQRWDTLESLSDPDPHEREAWEFAGELLMPADLFKREVKSKKTPDALVNLFKVSKDFVLVEMSRRNMLF